MASLRAINFFVFFVCYHVLIYFVFTLAFFKPCTHLSGEINKINKIKYSAIVGEGFLLILEWVGVRC